MTRVENLWHEIAATTDRARIFRRVDETHPLPLYAGIDHENKRVLLLVTKEQPPAIPAPGVVHVVCNQRENGEYAIVLELARPGLDEVFGRLCQDLVDATRNAAPSTGGEVLLRRLARWRNLLEIGQRTTLSEMALRGLIGELWFLQHVAFTRLSLDAAVQSWVGPLGAPQDFVIGEEVFEVKACSPGAQDVNIASVQQLDASPLVLVTVWLAAATPNAEGAFVVADFVRTIRARVAVSPSATNEFALRLAEAGYTDAEEYERTCYRITNTRSFQVRDGFPRLTRAATPIGIGNATYTVDLNACTPYETTLAR